MKYYLQLKGKRNIIFQFLNVFSLSLLTGCGSDSVSPYGSEGTDSKVAYVSESLETSEIYLMNIDGTEKTNICEGTTPAWSPDGTKIAYGTVNECSRGIMIMNADGTGQTRITNSVGVAWGADEGPKWSPDGTRIAFLKYYIQNIGIYSCNPDGTDEKHLTDNSFQNTEFQWSPDSQHIIFVTDMNGDRDIYLMEHDGSNQTNLTNDPGDDCSPCFSPDGGTIIFVSDRSGNRDIYSMNLSGGNVTNLTNTGTEVEYTPRYSPDGLRITYTRREVENTSANLYIMNADGSGSKALLEEQIDDVEGPVWFDNGNKIAFTLTRFRCTEQNYTSSICVVNRDGTGYNAITATDVRNYRFSISRGY